MGVNKILCMECREETSYHLQKKKCKKIIRDKEYEFQILEAVCTKCNEPVNLTGLIDYNANEIDRQYRQKEDLVTIKEIENLMNIYHIGKAPLSLTLGFGEITITRYLMGQIPSKEYSDIIRKALQSPQFMETKLNENKDKIGNTAYHKAIKALQEVLPLFELSEKMLLTISYIFAKEREITPLSLQKLLYYVQSLSLALYNKAIFSERCEAWLHGPVFKKVYEVFKTFKYNPIEDERFSMFQNRFHELNADEREVIDLVIESFGMYSGKVLEKITHEEMPWKLAWLNNLPEISSNAVISNKAMKDYFSEVAKTYPIDNVDGLRRYIDKMLH